MIYLPLLITCARKMRCRYSLRIAAIGASTAACANNAPEEPSSLPVQGLQMPNVRKRRSQLSKKSYDAKQMCNSRRQELMDRNREAQQANQHIEAARGTFPAACNAPEEQSSHVQCLTQVSVMLIFLKFWT